MSWSFKRNNENISFKSLYSTTSVYQLGEIKSKLINSKKSLKDVKVPTWNAFRSQIRSNFSPSKGKLRFDHYSNIHSFRASPKSPASPLRVLTHKSSVLSSLSGSSSQQGRGSEVTQVIRMDDFRRASEILAEMEDKDLEALPESYVQRMLEFCELVNERYKY